MLRKISSSQFRSIYRRLTGDDSVTDTQLSKEIDQHMKVILKECDPAVLWDLRINNERKASFEDYWQIIREKIYELLATVLDYQRLGLFICSRMLRNLESMIFIKWLSSGINLLLLLTSWLVNSALKWLHKLPD